MRLYWTKKKVLGILVLGLGMTGCFLAVVFYEHFSYKTRSFRMRGESIRTGPPLSPPFFVHVICSKQLPNGKGESRIVGRPVEVIGFANEWPTDLLTLRVTIAQAKLIDAAQQGGELNYCLCFSPKSALQEAREYVFPPPPLVDTSKITVEDLLRPVTKDANE